MENGKLFQTTLSELYSMIPPTLLPRTLHVFYHRFRFYATIGSFLSKENCVSAAANHRYHIWKRMRRVTVFSYRWCVVYLFSEGFRVRDIATVLYVGCTFLKRLIKLGRETSTVNYPAEHAVV